MKIVFLSHYFYPHVGGVEKHVYEISKELIKRGHEIVVVTQKYNSDLEENETIDGIKVIRFSYPKLKFLGIVYIWYFLWAKRTLFWRSDVIHIHDVFIWYLPFRFIFPNKKVYLTIHGLEWGKPLSFSGVWQKKLAVKLSNGSIGIGKFLEKYLKVRFDLISYGAVKK